MPLACGPSRRARRSRTPGEASDETVAPDHGGAPAGALAAHAGSRPGCRSPPGLALAVVGLVLSGGHPRPATAVPRCRPPSAGCSAGSCPRRSTPSRPPAAAPTPPGRWWPPAAFWLLVWLRSPPWVAAGRWSRWWPHPQPGDGRDRRAPGGACWPRPRSPRSARGRGRPADAGPGGRGARRCPVSSEVVGDVVAVGRRRRAGPGAVVHGDVVALGGATFGPGTVTGRVAGRRRARPSVRGASSRAATARVGLGDGPAARRPVGDARLAAAARRAAGRAGRSASSSRGSSGRRR